MSRRSARAGGDARDKTPPGWRCAVPGCTADEHVAHGWCRTHYQRWYRTGSPDERRRPGPRPWTADEARTMLTMIHTLMIAEAVR